MPILLEGEAVDILVLNMLFLALYFIVYWDFFKRR